MATSYTKSKGARNRQSSLGEVFKSYPLATTEHPYIAAKRGVPDGLRVVPSDSDLTIQRRCVAGWLALPAWSLDGELQTVQYIPPPGMGKKLNAPGAGFGGGYFPLGEIGPDSRIYVCEGIGQAWACARADYQAVAVVTFGSGRFPIVARALHRRFCNARLVFVADRGKEAEAQAIAREVGGAWVEMPTDKPSNYDANDYEAEHGSEALSILLRHAKSPPTRYQLHSAADLLNSPPLRWLVRNVVPANGLVSVFGPSGSGKSFLVLDVCAAIAEGAPEWFGLRVSGAPVTYCVLEGQHGMRQRVQAWEAGRGRAMPNRLRFIKGQSIDLRNAGDIYDLADAITKAGGRDGLVVIDTLNRAAPGVDENASRDINDVIQGATELQRRVGGTVLLVHHTGKDRQKGMRGHSSLYAALDAAIEVWDSGDHREWTVDKNKDGAGGARHTFVLHDVELGTDEYGEPITSSTVEPEKNAEPVARLKVDLPRGGNQRIAMNVLAELLLGSKVFGKEGAPPTYPCIELDAAVRVVAEHLTVDEKRRVERANDAIKGLVARGVFCVKNGWLWRK